MQIKKLALIGFSALALTAYGTTFASSHEKEDAAAKEDAQQEADAAQKVADEKQMEAEDGSKGWSEGCRCQGR